MRLKSLSIKDFRSVDGDVDVSLDAEMVLIHGPNGSGKTSILSAIELALTGAIPSLSRAEPEYELYLPHKDRPYGEVRLEMEDAQGLIRTGQMRVTTAGVEGTPLLSAGEAEWFSERSYLAQSTLGRLLEIYQHSDRKIQSPLTRFVKELLGLDRMEALISGLHSAGNIARLKAPVPAYGETRDAIATKTKERDDISSEMFELSRSIVALEGDLRNSLSQVAPSVGSELLDLDGILDILRKDDAADGLLEIAGMRREVDVSEASLLRLAAVPGEAERSAAQSRSSSALNDLDRWMRTNGPAVEEALGSAEELFTDASPTGQGNYLKRANALLIRLRTDTDRIEKQLAAHEAGIVTRDDLARNLTEAEVRLGRIEVQIGQSVQSNETLARALAGISPHVHGDVCPVCDRDYSEVSSVPLQAHLAAKVGALVEEAGRLQALTRDRTSTQADVAQLDRGHKAAAGKLIPDAELTQLKMRLADLVEAATGIEQRQSLFAEGDALRMDVAAAAQALFAHDAADQSGAILRTSLSDIAERIDVDGSRIAPSELIVIVRDRLQQRETVLASRQLARTTAIEQVNALTTARREFATTRTRLDQTEAALTDLLSRKGEADSLIAVAKDMVRQTRDARARVVRRVFNDELNSVWRDLFVRLAPEEPFIPAFAIPDAAGADIEAVLETHHRRGGRGGNPRAMLSAGNLNTAALTLFLAIHLSSSARLPWLVIDDPVQSMDEVHIAQFAALLRTLAKQMNRQVIIAVHERSLFDYLSLELSPTYEGERLNLIELGRNAVGRTVSRWDPRSFIVDHAIAA